MEYGIYDEIKRLYELLGRVDALTEYIMAEKYPDKEILLNMLGKTEGRQKNDRPILQRNPGRPQIRSVGDPEESCTL
jgi:hypothetical protein